MTGTTTSTTTEQHELRTRHEAAAELRLRVKTLDNWRSAGRGPKFLKLGDRVFYPRAELEAFKAACLRQTTAHASQAA